jgi:hypothetical protein
LSRDGVVGVRRGLRQHPGYPRRVASLNGSEGGGR